MYFFSYNNLTPYDVMNGSYIGNQWEDFSCNDLGTVTRHYNLPWIYWRCESNDYVVGSINDTYPLIKAWNVYTPSYPMYPEIYVDIRRAWQYLGEFRDDEMINFTSQLQEYMQKCTPDSEGYCIVPIKGYTPSRGVLYLYNLDIEYEYNAYKYIVRLSSLAENKHTFTAFRLIDKYGNVCDLLNGTSLTLPPKEVRFIRNACIYRCTDIERVVLEGTCGVYENLNKERVETLCKIITPW